MGVHVFFNYPTLFPLKGESHNLEIFLYVNVFINFLAQDYHLSLASLTQAHFIHYTHKSIHPREENHEMPNLKIEGIATT